MKESKFNLDKKLLFRETFNDEQSVRRNGGVPTDVTFENGIGSFNGTSSQQIYNRVLQPLVGRANPFTVRMKFNSTESVDQRRIFTHQVNANETLQVAFFGNKLNISHYNGASYVSRKSSTDCNTGEDIEAVFTYDGSAFSGVYINGTEEGVAGVGLGGSAQYGILLGYIISTETQINYDYLEIYDYAWSAGEVSNAYNNTRYAELSPNHAEQLRSELVTNGGFDDASAWSTDITTSIAGGVGVFSSTPTGQVIAQHSVATAIPSGSRIYYSFEIKSRTEGSFGLYMGATPISVKSAVGVYSGYFVTSGETSFYIRAVGTTSGTIDNVSCKIVNVNETKTILDVNAFGGTIRNKYSGDVYDVHSSMVSSGPFAGTQADAVWDATENALKVTPTGGFPRVTVGVSIVSGKNYKIVALIKATQTADEPAIWNGSSYVASDKAENFNGSYKLYTWSSFVSSTTVPTLTFAKDGVIANYSPIYLKQFTAYNQIPEVSLTDMEVVRDGSVLVPKFNGSTSKIDCGSYDDLTGDITVLAWIKTDDIISFPRILSNGKLTVYAQTGSGLRRFVCSSDFTTFPTSGINSLELEKYLLLGINREADGTVNFFINGVANGTTDQDSGTPAAGTTNLFIGFRTGDAFSWNDKLPQTRIISGLLTAKEHNQIYTSEKHKYNL